jgi:hypothetical protein
MVYVPGRQGLGGLLRSSIRGGTRPGSASPPLRYWQIRRGWAIMSVCV